MTQDFDFVNVPLKVELLAFGFISFGSAILQFLGVGVIFNSRKGK